LFDVKVKKLNYKSSQDDNFPSDAASCWFIWNNQVLGQFLILFGSLFVLYNFDLITSGSTINAALLAHFCFFFSYKALKERRRLQIYKNHTQKIPTYSTQINALQKFGELIIIASLILAVYVFLLFGDNLQYITLSKSTKEYGVFVTGFLVFGIVVSIFDAQKK